MGQHRPGELLHRMPFLVLGQGMGRLERALHGVGDRQNDGRVQVGGRGEAGALRQPHVLHAVAGRQVQPLHVEGHPGLVILQQHLAPRDVHVVQILHAFHRVHGDGDVQRGGRRRGHGGGPGDRARQAGRSELGITVIVVLLPPVVPAPGPLVLAETLAGGHAVEVPLIKIAPGRLAVLAAVGDLRGADENGCPVIESHLAKTAVQVASIVVVAGQTGQRKDEGMLSEGAPQVIARVADGRSAPGIAVSAHGDHAGVIGIPVHALVGPLVGVIPGGHEHLEAAVVAVAVAEDGQLAVVPGHHPADGHAVVAGGTAGEAYAVEPVIEIARVHLATFPVHPAPVGAIAYLAPVITVTI